LHVGLVHAPVDVALVYPPSCDPTAPYLALPVLTAALREAGHAVLPIDANLEAFDWLLDERELSRHRARLEATLASLDAEPSLSHADKLRYLAAARALGDAHAVPSGIAEAKATLRDEAGFFDPDRYADAVATIEAALAVVSASCYPLQLDFTAYRTPFGLLSQAEIARAASPERDPFAGFVDDVLVPRLRAAAPRVVGLSVCFPGQLQPAYAFALRLRAALPDVHLTVGGPGITQLMLRLSGTRLEKALGPFDSAVLFEGERTLVELAGRLLAGRGLEGLPNVVQRDRLLGAKVIPGHGMLDLRTLPAPDFDGLPLDRYLAPALFLPYDPTRGCYWGKCTFCHYGLAEVGTATYRERDLEHVVAQLRALAERHGTRYFYFSQDSVAPKTLLRLATKLTEARLELRWATDLKPEKYLTPERAQALREAGALACALGVESASPRVLEAIDKGAPVEVVSDVVQRLARAGIAAEAMCFTEFPTETRDEALQTLDFLGEREDELAVFIVGEFGLTHGSLVAAEPARFGIRETWEVAGDELGLGLFFEPTRPWKTDAERAVVDENLAALAEGWALRTYPWAGAVSTAHTLLVYDREGPHAFKREARLEARGEVLGAGAITRELRYEPGELARAEEDEARLWHTLVYERRAVSREAYEALASELPRALAGPKVTYRLASGEEPVRLSPAPRPRSKVAKGRRPSHSPNSTR
jgi:anaerobic magnesium-protoporphyrin IX monomethyl ester cyclase